MEPQVLTDTKNRIPFNNKTLGNDSISKNLILNSLNETQMTSSVLSAASSLTSPVDSGVQFLDSESDITSVMSMSGTACDLDSSYSYNNVTNTIFNSSTDKDIPTSNILIENNSKLDLTKDETLKSQSKDFLVTSNVENIMTKSDIANQNTTLPCDFSVYSSSAPSVKYNKLNCVKEKEQIGEQKEINEEEKTVQIDRNSKIDLELTTNVDIKPDTDEKLAETSGTEIVSSEIVENIMHVSMSEEVNESLKVEQETESIKKDDNDESTALASVDEQIVFRRQRKKKSSKSDTPKKRVSFHEDILNSTKIDDIHINHGFITHQPDISMSFFNWNSIRKPDVVKGRYSWAAEGDTPYYERSIPEREVKSEIYMNSRYSSTSMSSSSTGSVDSSSSNSLSDQAEGGMHEPCQNKVPKSSCLKKRSSVKRIDTQIVQEDVSLKHRKSESNLLDSNIFGSLKNILSFSTSVPLAERGVPEGQEDVSVYSGPSGSSTPKRRSFSLSNENISSIKNDNHPEIPKKVGNLNLEVTKQNLKLTPSEGFYPVNMNLPPNVVLCDSNVYEHKGISYSYEYDKFQKSLVENPKSQKPKSSTVYQMLLKDLNFFKRKEKEKSENDLKALAETPTPIVTSPPASSKKSSRSSITDWSISDTETISDLSENLTNKHLSSPKHKVNKANHYSVQSFSNKINNNNNNNSSDKDSDAGSSKFFNTGRSSSAASSSKTSLINRFLRNVTMKKLLDAKLQKKQKTRSTKSPMELYIKGLKPDEEICTDLDNELENELAAATRKQKISIEEQLGSTVVLKLKREVFRDPHEKLVNFYKVENAYQPNGDTKPLVVFLTNATLYITGLKPNQTFYNQFVLPYNELHTILVGPNGHTIHFTNADREMQFIVTTGSSDITGDLIGQLEMTMRRNRRNSMIPLPAVRHLTMREMAQLKSAVHTETTVDKEEQYFHYSIVHIQDASLEPDSTPLGPTKKGPLMFKTANDTRWETGYFILKGGVLYILSSPSNRLPLRAIPLSNGACLGAHRTPYCMRPHTFELLLGSMVLQLAAPDEYVASEWLQVLVQSASGLYNNDANQTQSCTLLLTSQHILTMREKFPNGNPNRDFKAQALSCANISDLTSFRIPLAEQSWCILEFACREVHETSGDLIIYFATNTELERFISTLEILWTYNNIKGDSFPLNTIPDNESINKKCEDTYRTLQGAWTSVNLVLH